MASPTPMGGSEAAPEDESVASSSLSGAGIGVADLERSFAFYRDVVGMAQRYELMVPGYVNEKIMYFPEGKPGADLVLMNYVDGKERNYENNPVKLVFYVPSATATIEAIRAQGLPIVSEPAPQPLFDNTILGFARDPDGYVLEIIEAPTLRVPRLGAIGIGVADLERAKDFYTRVMGMTVQGDLLQIPGVWDEWILAFNGVEGTSLVLLNHTDGTPRNYVNNPVKTVYFLDDAATHVESVRGEGLPILSEPMVFQVEGRDALIGLARDPDGYVVEMVTVQDAH